MKKNRFTLIELLVVIGIAAMLMAIAVPAYNKIINSKQVDRAAAALKLALEQAQVRAISSRKNVALIIPNGAKNKFYGSANGIDDAPDFNSNTQNNYYLGSARMAYVEKNGNQWEFVRWVPGSNWLDPFKNAKIVLVTDQYSDLPGTEGEELNRHVTGVYATNLYTGTSDGGFQNISNMPSSNVTSECGIVFSPLGGLRDTRRDLYIVVSEARLSGTNIKFSEGTHPINYIILDINRLNGKVSYHVYEN